MAAEAHSYVLKSVPAAGASLATVPDSLRITFSESADPNLSSIRALDSSGRSVTRGPAQGVPGFPADLVVPLARLSNGAYTVNYKVVSALDGHATPARSRSAPAPRPTWRPRPPAG